MHHARTSAKQFAVERDACNVKISMNVWLIFTDHVNTVGSFKCESKKENNDW